MENIKKQYKSIIVIVVLALGLAALIFLVQKQQLLKSRAGAGINETISVTDDQGREIEYVGNDTFKTKSQRINIGNKGL